MSEDDTVYDDVAPAPTRSAARITIGLQEPGATSEAVRLALEAQDIEARPTWKPMHLQPVFAQAPSRIDGTSDGLFATGLCLPSGSSLTEADQGRVIEIVRPVGRCCGPGSGR